MHYAYTHAHFVIQENRFSKCDICMKIHNELEKGAKSRNSKSLIMEMKRKHIAMVE